VREVKTQSFAKGVLGMTEFESQVLQELSVLKMQMQQLMGIGQPGRLNQLEARVDSHERSVQRLKGLAGALGGLITLVQVAIAYWSGRK
jgi:hypothetical protein